MPDEDPRLSELQAHARALGLKLSLTLIDPEGGVVSTTAREPAGLALACAFCWLPAETVVRGFSVCAEHHEQLEAKYAGLSHEQS